MYGNICAGNQEARCRGSLARRCGRQPRAAVGVSAWALIVSVATGMPGIRAAGICQVQQAVVYQRRRPERSVAYQVVQYCVETWLARRRAGGLDAGAYWVVD